MPKKIVRKSKDRPMTDVEKRELDQFISDQIVYTEEQRQLVECIAARRVARSAYFLTQLKLF